MTRLDYLCTISAPIAKHALKSAYHLHFEGELPKKGPYVLFAKHQTWIDQFLVGHFIHETTGRFAHYIMRKFPFPFNRVLEWYGGINVARSIDVQKGAYTRDEADKKNEKATQEAINVLRRNQPLVMFPEATRKDCYRKMKQNLKMIIPTAIINAQGEQLPRTKFIPFGIQLEETYKPGTHIWLRAGKPFYTTEPNELEQYLIQEIARLSGLNTCNNTDTLLKDQLDKDKS